LIIADVADLDLSELGDLESVREFYLVHAVVRGIPHFENLTRLVLRGTTLSKSEVDWINDHPAIIFLEFKDVESRDFLAFIMTP